MIPKHLLRQGIIRIFLWLLPLVSCLHAADDDRRLLMVHQWGEQLKTAGQTREFVAAVKRRQIDGVGLAVPWNLIEKSPGKYDFSWLDERLDLFVEAGLYFHLRVDCSRFYQPAWLDGHMMQTDDGRTLVVDGNMGPYKCLSFADPEVVREVADVTAAVAKHVWERYGNSVRHPLMLIYPMFTANAETEYPFEGATDYSPAAQASFRLWLAEAFGDLSRLNAKWGTKFTGWNQITLQQAPAWDLQRFRTETLGRLIDAYASAVRKACPAPVGAQFGSVWDGLSLRRGTLDVTRLGRNVDWVAFDDALDYDFAFSNDYIRGLLPGKWIAGETGGPWTLETTDARMVEYAVTSYDHGMKAIYIANLEPDHFADPRWTFWPKVCSESAKPPALPEARKAIVVSLATLYNMPRNASAKDLVYALYLKLSDGHRIPVDFINDTLIASHPDRPARYSEGLFVPDSMSAMTDGLLQALSASPVPVTMDRSKAGTLDEYGRPR